MVIKCTFSSSGSMSFNIGPLCIDHISVWLSLAGSKHSHTVSFGFDSTVKLLHHSAVSFTPSGNSILCSFSLSNFLMVLVECMLNILVAPGKALCPI